MNNMYEEITSNVEGKMDTNKSRRSRGQNRNDMKEQNSETNPQEGAYHSISYTNNFMLL